MSYVDAIHNTRKNVVHVIERNNKGERVVVDYPCEWSFYYDDPKGKYQTIFRTPVSKFSSESKKEFQREMGIRSNKRIWESDIKMVNKTLEKHYLNMSSPTLNVCFFDIEVDFSPTHGFAPTDDPFNKITAISAYCSWIDSLITLVIPPQGMGYEEAEELTAEFDNIMIFGDEGDMIEAFFDIIEEADVLSGWNSEGYDIPYLVNRTERILSKHDTRRFCLLDQLPRPRRYEKFGKEQHTYELLGRVHLDSLNLYQEYTYHEMHSYSLDAISEYELGEKKIQYEGTLDQLYNEDFTKFVLYNRQDTMLLKRLDDKLQFIDLANNIAHENTVLLTAATGAVGVTDQAIINYAHKLGLVVQNKERDEEQDTRAAGAYVAVPKKGKHVYVGAIDINSLYPSVFRALNMSPETMVGQILPTYTSVEIKKRMAANGGKFAEAWEGMFGTLEYQYMHQKDETKQLKIEWADRTQTTHAADEVHDILFHSDQPWTVSGNGTIFDRSVKGIVPGILETWYAERKDLQFTLGIWKAIAEGMPEDHYAFEKMKELIPESDRYFEDGVWKHNDAGIVSEQISFWDKRQLVKKINLNSLYGAVLNPWCRFYVFDIGQSTTLTGRCITKHMSAFVNEALAGEYDHIGKAIVYGDTDSVYFSIWPTIEELVTSGEMEWSKEACSEVYGQIAEAVNESFPPFMKQSFNCPSDLGGIIQGGLELIASSGLFITKKRYGLMIYDDEGTRRDVDGKPGKVKAMGMDLKRSDTPTYMQDFLMGLLIDVLTDKSSDYIVEKIKTFKKEFKDRPAWEMGTPKKVNNLTKYTKLYNEKKGQKGVTIPGHVAGAIQWNKLKIFHKDNYSMNIQDGQKTIWCRLKDNPLGYTSIGYPIDEPHLPEWFKNLPFDEEHMLDTIVDKKVDNLLGVMKWKLREQTDVSSTFNSLFEM